MKDINCEELLYDILKNSDKAKSSNEEALRLFYWRAYGITIPKLDGTLSMQTVFRKIRKLKEVYPNLKGDDDTIKAKEDKVCEYKEIAKSIPNIDKQKIEQLSLGGIFW